MDKQAHWEMNSGNDGAVIFDPESGTIANIPIDLIDWEANAKLIAQAPEMLNILNEFIQDVEANTVLTTATDWPDLCITYRKAQKLLKSIVAP
jgi:hypothetical protein